MMVYFCNFYEKVKNLFFWKDKYKTLIFLITVIIMSFIVEYLPIRYLIMIAMLHKFRAGSKFFENKKTHN